MSSVKQQHATDETSRSARMCQALGLSLLHLARGNNVKLGRAAKEQYAAGGKANDRTRRVTSRDNQISARSRATKSYDFSMLVLFRY